MRFRQKTAGDAYCPDTQVKRSVNEYHLSNDAGYELTISNLGATIMDVKVPCAYSGATRSVAVSLPDFALYTNPVTNPFMLGSTMGRYARSIANARFTLDGREYALDSNQGPHHFHGGITGFDKVFWRAKPNADAEFPQIDLLLERPDGDQGYPGSVSVTARFTLLDDGFQVEYFALASRATILGLCNHIFWNLTDGRSALAQSLQLNSQSVIVNDPLGIPIGEPKSVAGSDLDFRTPKPLTKMSLDNCFPLLSGTPACSLADPRTGLRLTIHTNKPAIAVFTAHIEAAGTDGICLQLTDWPDAPNRPNYPSVVLRPPDKYYNFARYSFDSI